MNTSIITNSFLAAMKASAKAAAAPKREVTKADLCRAFFHANPGLVRKDYIAEFMKLGMTEAGAATYWYNFRKEAKKQAALATIAALEEEVAAAVVEDVVPEQPVAVEEEIVAPKKSKKKSKKAPVEA